MPSLTTPIYTNTVHGQPAVVGWPGSNFNTCPAVDGWPGSTLPPARPARSTNHRSGEKVCLLVLRYVECQESNVNPVTHTPPLCPALEFRPRRAHLGPHNRTTTWTAWCCPETSQEQRSRVEQFPLAKGQLPLFVLKGDIIVSNWRKATV